MIGDIKQSNFIFMLKNILNLNGAVVLSKEQQKNISGGGGYYLGQLDPGGNGTTCVMLNIDLEENYKILYSPGSRTNPNPVAVGESCRWQCTTNGQSEYRWAGCGL